MPWRVLHRTFSYVIRKGKGSLSLTHSRGLSRPLLWYLQPLRGCCKPSSSAYTLSICYCCCFCVPFSAAGASAFLLHKTIHVTTSLQIGTVRKVLVPPSRWNKRLQKDNWIMWIVQFYLDHTASWAFEGRWLFWTKPRDVQFLRVPGFCGTLNAAGFFVVCISWFRLVL